jgi:four helix bundle protein
MEKYKDLIVWQKSKQLAIEVYKLSSNFPKSEIYGITSQIRRSAVSIPSNIAEGKMRQSEAEFRRFLKIAYGSGAELETQIEIAIELYKEIDYQKVAILLDEVMRMLNSLIKANNLNS